ASRRLRRQGRGPPDVGHGVVAAAAVGQAFVAVRTAAHEVAPTEHDHLRAVPYRRVVLPGLRDGGQAGGPPRVRRGVVPTALPRLVALGVEAAPHDHLGAGPHGAVA